MSLGKKLAAPLFAWSSIDPAQLLMEQVLMELDATAGNNERTSATFPKLRLAMQTTQEELRFSIREPEMMRTAMEGIASENVALGAETVVKL